MSKDVVCTACGDTGRNSKGGACSPCLKNGRQPLRDAVMDAVSDLFAFCRATGGLPKEEEVLDCVRRLFEPEVAYFGPDTIYAVGYRDKNGGLVAQAGPVPDLETMLAFEPEGLRQVFIVKLTRTANETEPKMTPVARWVGNEWERKKT